MTVTRNKCVILHLFQVRELLQPGSPTAAHSTLVPPFQYEISNLKAMTWYNMSVSCTNEIGPSPPSAWVQSNTTEGGESFIYIYIYTFSRHFYPKRLTIAFRLYIFISTCVPWESNPQPFAQLTQCSTTEPHRNTPGATSHIPYKLNYH